MKSTNEATGSLMPLFDCYVNIPNYGIVYMNSLPDISDSKGAAYNDEPVSGRTAPIKTYSHSENRPISMTIHLYATSAEESWKNLKILRAIQSCVYPRTENVGGSPFAPPVVCSLKCGYLLSAKPLCVVLRNYDVKFPTDVPWDEITYLPTKFDIGTSWDVVYRTSQLPGQDKILKFTTE